MDVRLRRSRAKKGFIRLVDVGSMFKKNGTRTSVGVLWGRNGKRREKAWTSCTIDRVEHVAVLRVIYAKNVVIGVNL